MIRIRWTGAAGLEITCDGQVVLIDPYLSRPGKREVFFGYPRPRPDVIEAYVRGLDGDIAAVIVGHTHLDHALDVPALLPHFSGPVLGSRSLRNLLALYGAADRVQVCRDGEPIRINDRITATLIPSVHGVLFRGRVPYPGEITADRRLPLKARDYRHGQVFIIQLEIEGQSFMHIGTAGYDREALEGRRCDVLFLCVPGWKKDPGYSDGLVKKLAPQTLIPFHYDDISSGAPLNPRVRFLPFQDLKGLEKVLRRNLPGAEVRWLKPFEQAIF